MTEQAVCQTPSDIMPQTINSLESDGILSIRTVVELMTQLVQRKRIIAAATASFTLIGLILCFILPIRYTGTTKIMPPKQSPSTTSILNSQVGMGSLGDFAGGGLLKDPTAIYVGLLESRPVTDTIISKFNLMNVYRAGDMTAARNTLKRNTSITTEKSGLLSISVEDANKQRAVDIANAYTAQLRELTKSISFTEASKRRLFFGGQVKAANDDLVAAEVAVQQIQQSRGLVRLDAQSGVIIGGLANVRAEIIAKEVELQALRSYSTEHNPDVQLAERELSSLHGEASRLEEHSGSSGFSDMGLKDVPKAGLELIRAQRELQSRQAYFEMLMRQYEAASLDEAKDAAIIQVVEPAIQPDRRSSPKRSKLLLTSTILGLVFGCILALLTGWTERELSSPAGAEAFQHLKCALMGKRLQNAAKRA